MKQTDKIITVRVNNIVGTLYIPKKCINRVVLHAKGGPSFGDSGKSSLWMPARKYHYALFVPDYLGYCRSNGEFNFKNCVKTLILSERFLKGEEGGIDCETDHKIRLSFKEIILLGSSWGGAIVPFLEKYGKSSIKIICLIKPVTDWATQGKTQDKEENVEKTADFIKSAWLNIYRGFDKSEWTNIFKGELPEFNPIDNLGPLDGKTLFICHGRKDTSINWKKSDDYYRRLKQRYPHNKIFLKLFKNEGHTDEINTKGLDYILKMVRNIGG